MENVLSCFRPAARIGWREVAWPREHGSWSLAFEPLVFGLMAAPSVGGAWLALAVVGAFFARRPLRIACQDLSPDRRSAARGVLALCGALILLAAWAVVQVGGTAWLVWLAPSAVAGSVFLVFDLRNAARTASAEVAGAVAFACLPGVFGVLAGCSPWEAGALAVVMCGRAVPTVLTVRAALRATKTGEGGAGPALACALVALVAGLFCAMAGWIGWVGPVGLAALAARSFGLLLFPRPVLRARTLGLIEAMVGLAFVVVVAAAWRA